MARSFYQDDEKTYTTPGLPSTPHEETEPVEVSRTTEIHVNKFGNLIATSPALQSFVSNVRETAVSYYNQASEKADDVLGTGQAHFLMSLDRVAQFKDEKEDFLPNACGVLTATLVGSIMARNRLWPIRFLTPTIFGAVALKYALPGTYDNISTAVQNVGLNLESKHFPEFKETRSAACKQVNELSRNACQLKSDLWNELVNNVSSLRKLIDDVKKD